MARADLLVDLIEYGLQQDETDFRRTVQAVSAEERAKQHEVLAHRIDELLVRYPEGSGRAQRNQRAHGTVLYRNQAVPEGLFHEKVPQIRMDQLQLPEKVKRSCQDVISEQMRAELLRSYGVEPRNKILLMGPPGNGKTSLAEAIATALMVPLITVRYDTLIGAYLGETASRLARLFDYVSTRQCVLFFDEFDTIGKERGDQHETGEIKRVVSSLLLQIDALPSYVVAIAATNHDQLLDQAVWRRFQVKLELPRPTDADLEMWFATFERRAKFSFGVPPRKLASLMSGVSYAEAEEFALSVFRKYILAGAPENVLPITEDQIQLSGRGQLKEGGK